MALLYVLVPLPMGLAYFRARFEKEAYAEIDPRRRRGLGPGYPRAYRVPRPRHRSVHGAVVRLDVAVPAARSNVGTTESWPRSTLAR